MPAKFRVLLVEDETLLRGLLAEILSGAGYEVLATKDAIETSKKFPEFKPDVALIDIDLGSGPTGVDLAQNLRTLDPELGLIFLTQITEPRFAGLSGRLIPTNAGYLLKSEVSEPNVLFHAIEKARLGLPTHLVGKASKNSKSLDRLSNRQIEIVKLVAQGLSNSEIASFRGISERAVRALLARTFDALEMSEEEGDRRVKVAVLYLRAVTGSESK